MGRFGIEEAYAVALERRCQVDWTKKMRGFG
jgi:hypothetical protein